MAQKRKYQPDQIEELATLIKSIQKDYKKTKRTVEKAARLMTAMISGRTIPKEPIVEYKK